MNILTAPEPLLLAFHSGTTKSQPIPSAEDINRLVLRENRIRDHFPDRLLTDARNAITGFAEEAARRTDLLHIPFVTIDGADARDFDDAVYAAPDPSADNPGGHLLYVAVADVAHYVRPGSLLDAEARQRMFSIYTATRAVHMIHPLLAERHCSLQEGRKRLAVVKKLRVNAQGDIVGFDVTRAVIRSRCRMTYERFDDYMNGDTMAVPDALHRPIDNLVRVYEPLKDASERRHELSLEIPKVVAITDRLGRIECFRDIHKFYSRDLIEKIMVAANAACASHLSAHGDIDSIYRIHGGPAPERIARARDTLDDMDIECPPFAGWNSDDLNHIVSQAKNGRDIDVLQNLVLNMIAGSAYSIQPLPHFGLALPMYLTVTSPIRKYTDLENQRRLCDLFGLNAPDYWRGAGLHVANKSITEAANRAELIVDGIHKQLQQRYGLAWLAQRQGGQVNAKIIYESNTCIKIGFEGCPYVHEETTRNLHFRDLKNWLGAASQSDRDTLLLPVNHVDVEGGYLALGLDALPGKVKKPGFPAKVFS